MLAHAQTRLVTLTGPPGIGKTRLAVACASAHAERSGCAPVFVDLAPVRDPALVMVELAQAVGVEPRGGTDLTGQLAAALGHEERLVVLDNCEHLLAAAPDVGRVLAACPRLRVLATSRERLRLSAEQEFPVPPLAMPAPADVADLSSLAANPSVALLLDRARRTNPSFDLTAANALLLASACVRLEGLPLAIELAAARLKVLTPGELVFRLSSRMEVLAGSTRDVPARQRALRSAIAWSYDLLDSGERALFRRLSVFAGGWTLADAGSVCAVNGDDALAMVESLLDKSLIRRLPGDEQTAEFSMLESLREYAAEQLAATPKPRRRGLGTLATTRVLRRSSRLPSACRRSEPGCCGSAATTRICAPRWITVWARGRMPGRSGWPPRSAGTTTPMATSIMARRSWTRFFPRLRTAMTRRL